MDNVDIDWLEGKYPSSVDDLIERRAGEFLAEIHAMAEEAMPKKPAVVRSFDNSYSQADLFRQLANARQYPKDSDLQLMMAAQQNVYPKGVYSSLSNQLDLSGIGLIPIRTWSPYLAG